MNRHLTWLLGSSLTLGLVAGCEAGTNGTGGYGNFNNNGGGGANTGGVAVDGGNGNTGGTGGSSFVTGGAGGEGIGGGLINPCGTVCGPVEVCDGASKGIDDNCNGTVDEDCPCSGGQASSCFKGDASWLTPEYPGCNAGTMSCTELGTWGACIGGNHATDLCFSADPSGCHPINAVPFATTDLETGTGSFSADADSATYTVTCPPGVNPCPLPTGSDFTALQSGEYTVLYVKTVGGTQTECTFPLYVGAPGLRVELSWNFADGPFDLDLHMKRPNSAAQWSTGFSASDEDCMYSNCRAADFTNGLGPHWFPDANVLPDPVNWFEDPDPALNSCYFAPEDGGDWSSYSQGCHNPRLDLDNISCDNTITDPLDGGAFGFCAPENINMDYPPSDEWIRVGVHKFSHFEDNNILPNVKIFCNGELAADLGTLGYDVPFEWTVAEQDVGEIWLVADVLFHAEECNTQCVVQPLYTNAVTQTPATVPVDDFTGTAPNGPAYPPLPF